MLTDKSASYTNDPIDSATDKSASYDMEYDSINDSIDGGVLKSSHEMANDQMPIGHKKRPKKH